LICCLPSWTVYIAARKRTGQNALELARFGKTFETRRNGVNGGEILSKRINARIPDSVCPKGQSSDHPITRSPDHPITRSPDLLSSLRSSAFQRCWCNS